ncbi:MAG: SH3 domain-containing protein [Thermomicrobiales bacterium]
MSTIIGRRSGSRNDARAHRSLVRRLWPVIPAIGLLVLPVLTPITTYADTNLTVGGDAVIAYTSGDLIRLRDEPSTSGTILGEYSEGTVVHVIDGPVNGTDGSLWYQVSVGGNTGYIVQDWLAAGGSMYPDITGTAWTNDSVEFRSGPSTSSASMGTIPAGTEVSLTGQTMDGFISAIYNGQNGWIFGAYLGSQGDSAPSTATEAPAEESVDWSGPTGAWHTNDSVNLRTEASTSSTTIVELPTSTNVTLTGAVANGFAQASTDYGDGWISQQYLSEGATSDAAPTTDSDASAASAPAATSSTGQGMVDFAMQYLGYPYVWAGKTPDTGFDCSGFTRWIVLNTLGYDIGGGVPGQTDFGTSVAWGDWQPGDLIFFADTYEPGLSHVGLYIGNGQMIHAENPSTGVVISDITTGYYQEHYAGARRLV